jgi:formylglycine-generating enzyme required for sulfatase activity
MTFEICCPECGVSHEVMGEQLGSNVSCQRCARWFPARAWLEPSAPGSSRRYRLVSWLGKGGMAAVFRGWDDDLRDSVAVKMPHGPSAWNAATLRRFETEVEAIGRLRHPNLCGLRDSGTHQGRPFLVMELLEGGTLRQKLKQGEYRQPEPVIELVRVLALGLIHAHRHNVIHRDLKPTNVLFDNSDAPRITDFGLALVGDPESSDRVSFEGQVLGSIPWLSPEQAKGARKAVGKASDVYALGILMFYLLTRRFPYNGPVNEHDVILAEIRKGPSRTLREAAPALDPRIDRIFRTATRPIPTERYPSMEDFAGALGTVLGIPRSRPRPKQDDVALAHIPPGEFEMGADDNAFQNAPVHTVRIRRGFLLGQFPVTQREFLDLMGAAVTPSFPGMDRAPMENVSWLDAVKFCNALSERMRLKPYYIIDGAGVKRGDGPGFRLPTEAQWEYACRANSNTLYSFGNDLSLLPNHAWYSDNAEHRVHEVGHWPANDFGLFDMHGNVWEWCWDWHARYDADDCVDPTGPAKGKQRVVRGGSWNSGPRCLVSAARMSWTPNEKAMRQWQFGFRVARSP